MAPFVLHGMLWVPVVVPHDDHRLVDRTGIARLATTDPSTHCVYLSNRLKGKDLETVMLHEVGHCAIYSFGLLEQLHSFVNEDNWIEAEEWLCNYLANYGRDIFHAAKTALARPVPKCKCEGPLCLTCL